LFLNTRSRSDAAAAAAATTPAPEASMASAAAPIAAAVAAAPAEGPAAAPAAPAAPPIAVDSLPRAGFWLRMGALLIDVVLVGVVSSLLHRGEGGHLMLLLLVAYAAVMWKLRGTTIGGIVCNLQVARLDGRPLDWATSIVRALGCLLSMVAAGLGFFWIAFDPEKQAWHDKIAGTVVVRAPAGRSLV
jgi:uncharacterized RDD family membrane protein YckC